MAYTEGSLSSTEQIASDLRLVGLRLIHRTERCEHAWCKTLDEEFDVDAYAEGASTNRKWLVSHREQPDDWPSIVGYPTITIRWANDNGNVDVQAAKIIDGRSKADVFVQGYPSGVSWSKAEPVRAALVLDAECRHAKTKRGKDGQILRLLCPSCCDGVRFQPRPTAVRITAQGPVDEFDSPEFMAAWTAAEGRR